VKQACPLEPISLNLWFEEMAIELLPLTFPSVGSIFGEEIKSAITTVVMGVFFSVEHEAGTWPMRSVLLNEIRGTICRPEITFKKREVADA
jgi:hypothetical protein